MQNDLPEDTAADYLTHLQSDIETYTAQLETLNNLKKRQEDQLNATQDRIAYIENQRSIAQQAKADFAKKTSSQ